ncbi:GGDEF domain-containing protein [Bacillus sp. PS06]|uniref:GGDEF domain-containing protein n=1 Tax=Bacillus sp. PS06 TaxID=2764176 RepID=UPI00177F1D56|nr:GGDEF domain-containing protein [Bacillus sp. PS06]MBD8070896.1 diguanylate cyclase [Bacillus sp. PS06]
MSLFHFLRVSEPSVEKRQLLERQLLKENIQRCKLFASIVIVFEAILIMMTLYTRFSTQQPLFDLDFYLIMYLTLMIASVLMILFIRWFEKSKIVSSRRYTFFRAGLLSFVVFFLVWGAVVTLGDQKEYGHVMAFVVNVMCVSVLFHATNKTILQLYILPIAVLMIGLPYFQPSSAVVMGHYINLSVFLFFCWLASRMLYRSNATNFYNKLLLTETNESLALKISENENINRKLEKANKQLKELSLMDELTRISNRRGYYDYVREGIEKSNVPRKLSVIILDIDAFKLFNDHYGHLEGDNVLQRVAQTINTCVDDTVPGAFAARFGGEEFVIASFDLDSLEVYELANLIRQSVTQLKIIHEYSSVSEYVTISLGFATNTISNMDELQPLMEAADQALYKAKTLGRNQVAEYQTT